MSNDGLKQNYESLTDKYNALKEESKNAIAPEAYNSVKKDREDLHSRIKELEGLMS